MDDSVRAGELRIAVAHTDRGSLLGYLAVRCLLSLCDYGEGPGSLWETLRPFFLSHGQKGTIQAQDWIERQGEKAAGHTCSFIPFSRSVTVTDVLDSFLR